MAMATYEELTSLSCTSIADGVADANKENLDDLSLAKISCSSCLEVFDLEILYRCSTCDFIKQNKEELTDLMSFFCESCVLCHLRRRHEIVDSKGYPPDICDTHKKAAIGNGTIKSSINRTKLVFYI